MKMSSIDVRGEMTWLLKSEASSTIPRLNVASESCDVLTVCAADSASEGVGGWVCVRHCKLSIQKQTKPVGSASAE